MFVALIKWTIKSGCVTEFREAWETKYKIEDKSGLISEFLCETSPQKYVTWDFADSCDEPVEIFVNVGLWVNEKSFNDAVAKNFKDDKPIEPFEAKRRVRVVFDAKSWRRGDVGLPEFSSVGAQ